MRPQNASAKLRLACVFLCAAGALPHALSAQQDTLSAAAAQSTAASLHTVSHKDAKAAERTYLASAKLFKDGNFPGAIQGFERAATLDPTKTEYAMALTVARQHLIAQRVQQAAEERRHGRDGKANSLIAEARTLDPTSPLLQQRADAALEEPADLKPHLSLSPGIVLQHGSGQHDFHLRGDTRSLLQQVYAAYGVKIAFDQDLPSRPLRLDVDAIDFDQAEQIADMLAGVFSVPLDEHTLLLAKDSEENRKRLERQVEETISLPGLTSEELTQVGNVVRNIFNITQATTQQNLNTLVVRAPARTIDALNRTLDDLVEGGGEVMLHLQLYEVNHSKSRNTGLTPLQSLNLFSLAAEAQTLLSQNASVIQQLIASGAIPATATPAQIALYLLGAGIGSNSLLTGAFLKIGGGLTTAILSAGNSPTLQLALTESDTRTLDDVRLRVADRGTTTFRSGQRYPVVTSVYSNVATTSTNTALSNLTVNGVPLASLLSQFLGGAANSTIPQFQFEDLGLTVKATTQVLRNADISVHLEVKIEALTGQALNNIPILGSRSLSTDLTIPAGSTAVIANVVTHSEASAVNGTPGLSELPGFQSLTQTARNTDDTDLILLLTPILTRRGHLKLTGPYIPVRNVPSE